MTNKKKRTEPVFIRFRKFVGWVGGLDLKMAPSRLQEKKPQKNRKCQFICVEFFIPNDDDEQKKNRYFILYFN